MKNKQFLKYINRVLGYINCDGKTKKMIREDLYENLSMKAEETNETDPVRLMGEPRETAREFIENLELTESAGYEYRTALELFGVPLVHINLKRSGTAKGFIAIGSLAIGLIAIGRYALGVISLGALSAGVVGAFGAIASSLLFSAGGLALSCGVSVGAVALSYGVSAGAVAVAKHYAMGAVAVADVAMGNTCYGTVSIFTSHGSGDVLVQLPAAKEAITGAILKVYPDAHEFIVRIFASAGI